MAEQHQRLVKIHAIGRWFLRCIPTPVTGPLAEQRLAVAVILQAMIDVRFGSLLEGRSARAFLLGPDLQIWVDHLGLDIDFVRTVARKSGYLLDDTTIDQPKPEHTADAA